VYTRFNFETLWPIFTKFSMNTMPLKPPTALYFVIPTVGNSSTAHARTCEVDVDVNCVLLAQVDLTQSPFLEYKQSCVSSSYPVRATTLDSNATARIQEDVNY
jgi:hypothetical protein